MSVNGPRNITDVELEACLNDGRSAAPTDTFNFAIDVFDRVADKLKDKVALWFLWDNGRERKFSYSELGEYSRRLGHLLQKRCGVGKGDVVMVSLPRAPEWWISVLAINRIGGVYVPSSVSSTEYEKVYQLERCEAKAVICGDSLVGIIDKVASKTPKLQHKIMVRTGDDYFTRPSPLGQETGSDWLDLHGHLLSPAGAGSVDAVRFHLNDTCVMYFTSGTTGRQKLALHTPWTLYKPTTDSLKGWVHYGIEDVFWQITDPSWAKASYSFLSAPFTCGTTLFSMELKHLDFMSCLKVLEGYPITLLCAPPTGYRQMIKCSEVKSTKFRCLKRCYSSGERLDVNVGRSWMEYFNIPIREAHGQTEMGFFIAQHYEDYQEGSMGKPVESYRNYVAIVSDDLSQELSPGEEGLLVCRVLPERPRGLFIEYKDEPNRTLATISNGYYLTGDRAVVDENGYYYHLGRADDVINTTYGNRVGPVEIENVLVSHEDVIESAVVSSPHRDLSEVVKAFIVLKHETSESDTLKDEIKELVRGKLGEIRVPHKIEFVSSLPKTSSGKLQRSVLRRKEWEN